MMIIVIRVSRYIIHSKTNNGKVATTAAAVVVAAQLNNTFSYIRIYCTNFDNNYIKVNK